MALSTIYTMTFNDVEDITWEVTFQKDYAPLEPVPTLKTIVPGVSPLNIAWNQSEKYQIIVGSSVDMQMVYNSNLDNLFTDESQSIYVLINRDSSVVWRGFIVPGQYHRQFNQPKHYVTITATDGLGELKNIKFEDGSGDPYYYQEDELQVLADCLDKTGMTLTVRSAVNIYDDNHTATTSHTPLNQTYIYPDMYWDEQTDERSNCDVPIEDILRKYGATLRQSAGIWYILRPNSFSVDTIYYRTSVSGSTTGSGNYTSYKPIDADNFYIHADQELTRLLGVGRCEIMQDPPRRSNLFKSGAFEEFMWDGFDFNYWVDGGTPAISHQDNTLLVRCNESVSTPTDYIEQSIYVYYANSISISFDWTAEISSPIHSATIFLQIYDGTYYYTNSGWQSGVGYYTIIASVLSAGNPQKATISIPMQFAYGYDRSFTLRFRIYEFQNEDSGLTNYFNMDNLRLDVGMDLPETKLHSYDNPVTINNIREETIALGDSWITDLFASATVEDVYYINTYDTSFSLTTDWSIYGDPTASAPLCEVLARQTVEGYRKSLDVFRGSIRSQSLDFSRVAFEDSNLTDDYGFSKRYFPNGISYDARLNEWSGEWLECPATYTDSGLEWDSQEAGGDGTITANELEIDAWTSDVFYFAEFEDYTVVDGETVRIVVNLTDDGSSVLPGVYIDGGTSETRAWGLNYYTFTYALAGTHTLSLGRAIGSYINMTCVVDIYTLTGI